MATSLNFDQNSLEGKMNESTGIATSSGNTSRRQHSYCDNNDNNHSSVVQPSSKEQKESQDKERWEFQINKQLTFIKSIKGKIFDEITNSDSDIKTIEKLKSELLENEKRLQYIYRGYFDFLKLSGNIAGLKKAEIEAFAVNKKIKNYLRILEEDETKEPPKEPPKKPPKDPPKELNSFGSQQDSETTRINQIMKEVENQKGDAFSVKSDAISLKSDATSVKSGMTFDSMLTGNDLSWDENDLEFPHGGAKRKTLKPKLEKKGILKQMKSKLNPWKMKARANENLMGSMEDEKQFTESIIFDKLSKLRAEKLAVSINNCRPEKFQNAILDLQNSLEHWQKLNTKLIKLFSEFGNNDEVMKRKLASKEVTNAVNSTIRDVHKIVAHFHKQKRANLASSDDTFSSVSDDYGQFASFHGDSDFHKSPSNVESKLPDNISSKLVSHLKNSIFNKTSNEVEDRKFLEAIYDLCVNQERDVIRDKAMKARRFEETQNQFDRKDFQHEEPSSSNRMFRNYAQNESQFQGGRSHEFPAQQNQSTRCCMKNNDDYALARQERQINGKTPNLKLKVPELKNDAKIKDFYHFKNAFTTIMDRENIDSMSLLYFLQDAVKNPELKSKIMGFPYTYQGYLRAFRTLKRNFGDEQSLKIDRYIDIEKLGLDTRSAKGLLDISATIDSILADPMFGNETERNSLLYSKIISKFSPYVLDHYNTRFPKDTQDLDALAEFVEDLATQRKEQEFMQQLNPRQASSKPRSKPIAHTRSYSNHVDKDKWNKSNFKKRDPKCGICHSGHFTNLCPKLKVSWEEKIKVIRDAKLCFNCFSPSHTLNKCYSKLRCKICLGKHNIMLHKPSNNKAIEMSEATTEELHVENNSNDTEARAGDLDVVLPMKYSAVVIPIKVSNEENGCFEETLAYLDNGSEETWITPELAKKLYLEPVAYGGDVRVKTVMGSKTYKKTKIVQFGAAPTVGGDTTTLRCRVMGNVPQCSYLNIRKLKKKYKHLQGVPLMTSKVKEVGLIIGRDYTELLEMEDKVIGNEGEAKAYKFKLGWAVMVPKNEQREFEMFHTRVANASEEFEPPKVLLGPKEDAKEFVETPLDVETSNTVSKMLLEDNLFIEEKPAFTKDEEKAYEFVKELFTFEEGRPVTAIPYNEKENLLENNMPVAVKRLGSTQAKLEKMNMTQEFDNKIEDSLKKDYIEEIKDPEPHIGPKTYLPVSVVIKKDRTTTKVRSCMDASAEYKGLSLNKAIRPGPNIQEDMIKVLIRFRKKKTAVSMDVSEMFPQIIVRKQDRDRLRFLVKRKGEVEFRTYRHKRVPFGLNCSPFLAQYTVVRTAEEMKGKLPLAHEIITSSRYVDDVCASLDNSKEAKQALIEVPEVFKGCGMEVHKVLSNDPEVLDSIDVEKRLNGWTKGKPLSKAKVLGLEWDPDSEKDTLNIAAVDEVECPTTKRGLLTCNAKIYDPLSVLSPVTVEVKRLLQDLWSDKRKWDEPLLPDKQTRTSKWFKQLKELKNVKFPRQVAQGEPKAIHVFADASDYAYGISAYLQTDSDCGLICAKSRVHPIKPKSIPRKELQAAVLASKVVPTLKAVWPDLPITLWTDSQNCLAWIQSDSRQYKPYINNRVSAILDNTRPEQWRWVDTANNPADIASRGMELEQLKDCDLWWKGPLFLRDEVTPWPKEKKYLKTDEELKKNVIKEVFMNYVKLDWLPDFDQFQTLDELAEETAQLNRARQKLDDNITIDDKEEALKILVKEAQAEGFPKELEQLEKGGQVSARSNIVKLNPILDNDGLIRCLTRLRNANIPESTSKPVLLPKDHAVTKLIILDQHEKTRHAYGVDYTLSEVRRKFWIPSGRQQIKKALKNCRQCRINFGMPRAPKMAPLPFIRTDGSMLPFTHTSVDFSGAYITVQGRGRSRKKRYLCLFVCNETRAVHLEMVNNLETDGFIMALCNFMSRRGKIKTLTSDNGTNFRGAERELRELIEGLDQDQLEEYARTKGFEFRFNPPGAPHMGGVFESLIKSAKRAIRAILKNAEFTDAELQSAFIGAEDLLNSRPLCYQTNDPNDMRTLTPASFLHGRLDGSFLPPNVDRQDFDPRQRWRLIQRVLKQIWKRWIREILPTLGPRQKWTQDNRNFEVGDEVLVVDKNLPRYRWNIGRVTATYPGRDGVVRIVDVRGENGDILKKTVHRLVPLS